MSRNESTSARHLVRSICPIFLCILFSAVLFVGLRTLLERTATQPSDDTTKQMPSGENKAVEAARIHLARQLNVDVALVSADSLERVWWHDNCLGLPRPGEKCEPLRTPGFHVFLAAGEYQFSYRTDIAGENVRLEDFVDR